MPLPRVTVLPAAEKFMRLMVRFSGHPDGGFRLRVTAGGCSGYSSEFTVEPRPLDGDTELTVNGMRLFLPAETCKLLDGVIVDHTDKPGYSGLSFFNPNGGACDACAGGAAGAAGPDDRPPAEVSVALSSIKRL
jgi:iron-sulfur cluster assembly protein